MAHENRSNERNPVLVGSAGPFELGDEEKTVTIPLSAVSSSRFFFVDLKDGDDNGSRVVVMVSRTYENDISVADEMLNELRARLNRAGVEFSQSAMHSLDIGGEIGSSGKSLIRVSLPLALQLRPTKAYATLVGIGFFAGLPA